MRQTVGKNINRTPPGEVQCSFNAGKPRVQINLRKDKSDDSLVIFMDL